MRTRRCVLVARCVIGLCLATLICATAAFAVTEKVLHSFTGSPDGDVPYGALVIDASGNLFGTTLEGGSGGDGTVFELSPSGSGWTETVIHSFTGAPDGAEPWGSLVFDAAGNLYGTTQHGGTPSDGGVVFKLSPSGNGWSETVIYSFESGADGCQPTAGLTIDSLGNLYGTTTSCGINFGTVFELSPSGDAWNETTLWEFGGVDGANPYSGVTFHGSGNLYGTTVNGGYFGLGNVFKLTNKSGSWIESSVFSFTGGNNGCEPYGGLVFSTFTGDYVGTTKDCGADNVGTVFELTPTRGQWTMTILHSFTGAVDGALSTSGIVSVFESGNGRLYGTTQFGGFWGNGTVFSLNFPFWRESEYSFVGAPTDGANPYPGLTLGKGGAFGTTSAGGTNNLGTVYEIK